MSKYQCGGHGEGSRMVEALQIQLQTLKGAGSNLAREGQTCKGCVGSRDPESEGPALHYPWSLF